MTRSRSRPQSGKKDKSSIIISTVKDPIPTKELLVRLQNLSDELSAVDQEKVEVNDFRQVLEDLVNPKLLGHLNSGVQAYVCAAISDVLRINAPNAPFTASQLSDIFRAFFKQLKKLSDPENPYFQQQCYLLKRLAEVRSAILITDLPDTESLVQLVFDTFYGLSSTDFPTRLEPLASDILSEIIAESETIPHDVLKLILNRFLTPIPQDSALTTLNSKISNTGFNFSMYISENNLDRMSRLVAQYFSEMLYETTNQPIDENEDNQKVKEKKLANTLAKLNKIHLLSVQIWKYIPELLSSVMALIDDELNADDEKVRILATETIGQMIGSTNNYIGSTITSKVNFFITHKDTWNNWLKKTTDVSPYVRSKWVQQLPLVLNSLNSTTTEVNSSLINCLYKCLLDTDERVREAACNSISKIPFKSFTAKVCNQNIMNTLTHLTREKNTKIRNQVINIFGSVYNNYMEALNSNEIIDFGSHNEIEIANLEKLITEVIPNQILSLIYINDRSITATVDTCIFENLIPISESSSAKRVQRIAQFYSTLDAKGKQSFIAINKRQQQISKVIQTFIETAESSRSNKLYHEEKENIEDSERIEEKKSLQNKLDKILKWICVSFPEGMNTYNCLERLHKLNKTRFFYLLKICCSTESDYNTVRNSMRELLAKLADPKNIKLENERSNVSPKDMISNMKLLLIRSSVLLYNKSNVVELIKYSKNPDHEWYLTANEILEHISITIPDVFKFHINALTNLIIKERSADNTNSSDNPQGLQLRVIYHFIKKFPELFPVNINFTETLKAIATEGSPREAKYSVKILSISDKNQFYFSEIITKIYPLNLEHVNIATHLSTIAELFVVDPMAVQEKSSDLTSLLIKEIFLKNRTIDKDATSDDNSWIEDDYLDSHYQLHSTLYEKLLALRMFVNRLIGLESSHQSKTLSEKEKEDITNNAQPVLKLLMSFIGNSGEIINKNSSSWPTPELYKQKIRLTAGLYLLKLAKIPIYSEMIHPTTLRRLTFLLTDQNENVRSKFLLALQKKLVNELISERFLPIVFFSATEHSNEIKNNAIMWIQSLYKRQQAKKSISFEKSLVRLIHMIAHHEQYLSLLNSENEEGKKSEINYVEAYSYALKYLIFYISLIANQDNISLLYYFASRVKQHRDATIDSDNYEKSPLPSNVLNLYRIAELTQFTLKEYSDHKSWPMQTWPGKLKLPGDIYSAMVSSREAQNIVRTVFIPDQIQKELKALLAKKLLGGGTKKRPSLDIDIKVKKPKTIKVEKKLKASLNAKVKAANKAPSRKSSRSTKKVSYTEDPASDDSDMDSEDEDVSFD